MMYKRNFELTAKFIHELTEDKVTIPNLPFGNKEGKFIFDKSFPSFLFYPRDNADFLNKLFTDFTWYDSLEVDMKSGSYVISRTSLQFPNRSLINANYTCSVQFDRLIDPQWDEKTGYFYRYFLPIENERWLSLIEHTACYQDDDIPPTYDSYRCVGGIRVDFSKERQIHLFSVYMGASLFLAIESQFPCTYDEMSDYMHTISLSLGLVTSVAPFDYAYIVASETLDFDGRIMGGLIRLRPTMRVLYKQHLSDPIKEKDFVKLVLMLHRNKNLARAAMMLLVASNDIESLGSSYSVALETICLELFKENKDIFEECLIEKPWGKDFKNNDEKLTKPFELLKSIKYDLSEVEKLIIKTRNSFLHGDIPKGGESADKFESVDELQYISSELRRLCMILLFRYVGIKEPQPAIILYDEKVKQTVDEKLLRRKQKEEEEKEKKKNNTRKKSRQGKGSPTNERA